MKPSQFGNVCTKFQSDPCNENRAIKKIRWVGQIRPGPLKETYCLQAGTKQTPCDNSKAGNNKNVQQFTICQWLGQSSTG